MKKIIVLIISLIFIVTFTGCGKSKIPIIGISQYGTHASLDNCRQGFIEGIKEAGLKEGSDFQIDYQNANFDDSIATQIAESFSAKNVAIMCAIATPSATACYAAAKDKDIPVIFNAITDPKAAKLTEGNITGISDALPVDAQLRLIRSLQPKAKKIGVIYTMSEPNSVSAIAEYKDMAGMYSFILEEVGVTSQSEVTQAVDILISKNVDCFSNLADNNVVAVLPAILEKTNQAKIPVYGSEIEQVKIGCIASAGIDYFALGKEAGKMAAEILKGENSAYNMEYKTVTKYNTYVNYAALSEFEIKISDDIASDAIEVK